MSFYRYEPLMITEKINVRVMSSRIHDFVNDKKKHVHDSFTYAASY